MTVETEETQDLEQPPVTPEEGTGDGAAETADEDDRDDLLDQIQQLQAQLKDNDKKRQDSDQAKKRRERETAAKSGDMEHQLKALQETVQELSGENETLRAQTEQAQARTRRGALAQAVAKKAGVTNVQGIERLLGSLTPDDGVDTAPATVTKAAIATALRKLKTLFPSVLEPPAKEQPRPTPPNRPGLTMADTPITAEQGTEEYYGQLGDLWSKERSLPDAYAIATGRIKTPGQT